MFATLFVLIGNVSVSAAGFRLPDASVAAMSMANAFTAQADDASATWYNPAATTKLDGTQVQTGANLITPTMRHTPTNGQVDDSASTTHIQPHLFATHKIGGRWSASIGVTAPFGLASDWSATNSPTKYVATYSQIVAVNTNANLAYKLTDGFSVAGGLDIVQLDADLAKSISPYLPQYGELSLKGSGTGVGANLAAYFAPNDKLSFGASWRSDVRVDINGTAKTTGTAVLDNSASTTLTLPASLQFGTSWKATEKLIVNADLEYTAWSSYDKLIIQSQTISQIPGSTSDTSTDIKDWKDVWAVRLGMQYAMRQWLKIRGGLLYDSNPVPDERFETRVPDSDRIGFSTGLGLKKGPFTCDIGYMFLYFKPRNILNSIGGGSSVISSLNGEYNSHAHLVGATLGYAF